MTCILSRFGSASITGLFPNTSFQRFHHYISSRLDDFALGLLSLDFGARSSYSLCLLPTVIRHFLPHRRGPAPGPQARLHSTINRLQSQENSMRRAGRAATLRITGGRSADLEARAWSFYISDGHRPALRRCHGRRKCAGRRPAKGGFTFPFSTQPRRRDARPAWPGSPPPPVRTCVPHIPPGSSSRG